MLTKLTDPEGRAMFVNLDRVTAICLESDSVTCLVFTRGTDLSCQERPEEIAALIKNESPVDGKFYRVPPTPSEAISVLIEWASGPGRALLADIGTVKDVLSQIQGATQEDI